MKKLALLLFAYATFFAVPHGYTAEPVTKSCVAIDASKLRSPIANVLRLWGQQSKFWPAGSTLRVKFLDGSKGQQDRAWQRFQAVDALVNLSFQRVVAGDSEIRVSFQQQGHWSYLGRDCLGIGQRSPTMSLQLSTFDPPKEWDRVAKHECLHAVGFDHEQAHPSANIPWNKPVVYAYYLRTQGWNKAQVDRQVLSRYTGKEFIGSAYDKRSIMHYPIDKQMLLDAGFAVGWNFDFSTMDVDTLKKVYPAPKPKASVPAVILMP